MTSRKDYFEISIFVGFIILAIGIIGFIIPYHPFHLFIGGLVILFGGYYFYHAEIEYEKNILKQKDGIK